MLPNDTLSEPETGPAAAPQVDLPSFSGPLDLLLHLIERNELDVTAISLSKVASQYLEEVEKLKNREDRIGQLMDFLVIGAQLALIKSRALLPQNPVTIEGEEEEDPAEALARRLMIYKRFKESAAWFQKRIDDGYRSYLRIEPPNRPVLDPVLDLTGVTPDSLFDALKAVLERAETLADSVKVAERPTITIEGQMSRLRRTVRRLNRFPFHQLLSKNVSRAELSVTLLAVLELVKRHEVKANQELMFGPIEIERANEPVAEPEEL